MELTDLPKSSGFRPLDCPGRLPLVDGDKILRPNTNPYLVLFKLTARE